MKKIFVISCILFTFSGFKLITHQKKTYTTKVTFTTTQKARVYFFLFDETANKDTSRIKYLKYQCNGITARQTNTRGYTWTGEIKYEGNIKGFGFNVNDRDSLQADNPLNLKSNISYLLPSNAVPMKEVLIQYIKDIGSCEENVLVEVK